MPVWISIFRGIPWMELIVAAPAIARGARKLWAGIRRRSQPDASGEVPDDPEARLTRLESELGELKKELAASSEVIKAMAEQNERLVEALGILRVRVRVALALSAAAVALAVGLASRLLSG